MSVAARADTDTPMHQRAVRGPVRDLTAMPSRSRVPTDCQCAWDVRRRHDGQLPMCAALTGSNTASAADANRRFRRLRRGVRQAAV